MCEIRGVRLIAKSRQRARSKSCLCRRLTSRRGRIHASSAIPKDDLICSHRLGKVYEADRGLNTRRVCASCRALDAGRSGTVHGRSPRDSTPHEMSRFGTWLRTRLAREIHAAAVPYPRLIEGGEDSIRLQCTPDDEGCNIDAV